MVKGLKEGTPAIERLLLQCHTPLLQKYDVLILKINPCLLVFIMMYKKHLLLMNGA